LDNAHDRGISIYSILNERESVMDRFPFLIAIPAVKESTHEMRINHRWETKGTWFSVHAMGFVP